MRRDPVRILVVVLVLFCISFAELKLNVVKGRCLFTFAQITDSQFTGSSAIFEGATAWLARQDNVVFVVHTGDIVNGRNDVTAWKNAYDYMRRLDGSCNWTVLAGDNDVGESIVDLSNYVNYFGEDSIDHFFIVESRLLFILFSWTTPDGRVSSEKLDWMDRVITDHPDLYVVVCLHSNLYGVYLPGFMRVPNADEIWNHIDRHENVILTLSGHSHMNWVRIHVNKGHKVWSISTEALAGKGYIRLFDVYEDRIDVYGYSDWTKQYYRGPLDSFTVELNPNSYDVDGDLWGDDMDVMPTDPLVPNGVLIGVAVTMFLVTYLVRSILKKRAPLKHSIL